jgi:hypothetical protein
MSASISLDITSSSVWAHLSTGAVALGVMTHCVNVVGEPILDDGA